MFDFFYQSKQNWLVALRNSSFRKRLIPGVVLVAGILSAMPFFFPAIEKRNGTLLHDWILEQIPSHNFSVAIFIIIWMTGLLAIIRAIKDPDIFLVFAWAYIFVSALRATAIIFIPLNPPVGLVELIDPLSSTFYGHVTITKDLFFSGHTSTIFLIFLCLKNKIDKVLTLTATFFLAILLMIQHIHYVIDII
ncbi:MAG TPA: hypothetical protein VHZ50_17110, partial [Puia sp.]|nr:hypothetical protein [Puia sp.]